MAALRAGKSVLIEKPFTMNAVEAEELAAEAAARGLLVMEGMWTLCNPLVRDLLARLDGGEIGDLLSITANVGPLGIPTLRGAGSRMEDPALGASFLLECLVYPLALSVALIPELSVPDVVHATAAFSAEHIDEAASMVIGSHGGAVASMGGGFAFGAEGRAASRLQITGTRGWAEIVDDIFNPSFVRIGTSEGVEELQSSAADRGMAWEIEEAARAMRAGRGSSELVPIDGTVRVLRILDRARESAGIIVGS